MNRPFGPLQAARGSPELPRFVEWADTYEDSPMTRLIKILWLVWKIFLRVVRLIIWLWRKLRRIRRR